MERVRMMDDMVNERLNETDAELKQLEMKLKNLQDQKQNITKASPAGSICFWRFF